MRLCYACYVCIYVCLCVCLYAQDFSFVCRIQTISWTPRAQIYHNFISDSEARHIIELARFQVRGWLCAYFVWSDGMNFNLSVEHCVEPNHTAQIIPHKSYCADHTAHITLRRIICRITLHSITLRIITLRIITQHRISLRIISLQKGTKQHHTALNHTTQSHNEAQIHTAQNHP